MSEADRRAAIGRSNTLTVGYLACHVTATWQLPHEVNKLLVAYT